MTEKKSEAKPRKSRAQRIVEALSNCSFADVQELESELRSTPVGRIALATLDAFRKDAEGAQIP